MADAKISALTDISLPLQLTDVLPWVRAGDNFKSTLGDIRNLLLATPFAVIGASTAGAEIRLPEDTDNGSNYVGFKAPDSISANAIFTLPGVDGTNGQALVTNGSKVLSWGDVGGSAAPFVLGTNLVEQRNSTNAQTLRIYNTYTDDSNYERGGVRWNANTLEIGTEAAAGTGSERNVAIVTQGVNLMTVAGSGDSSRVRFWNLTNNATVDIYNQKGGADQAAIECTSNSISLGPADGSYSHMFYANGSYELTEVTAPSAPAANKARLYAEDNGSGKTRLVVRFASGAAQVLATEP